MPLLVFLAVAIGFGVLLQRLMQGIAAPALLSALLSSIAFHAIGYLIEGYLDSLVMISFITTFGFGFVVSLLIGLMMRRSGKKSKADR